LVLYQKHAGKDRGSACKPAAVDWEDRPVDIGGRRRTEEDARTCDVARLAPAARRDALEDLTAARRIGTERRSVVRRDVAGRNAVHVDTLPRPLVRERLHELADCALRRRVARNRDAALERQERAGEDDLSPANVS